MSKQIAVCPRYVVCTVPIWNMFQKCTFFRTAQHACQSEKCLKMAHVSEWHATRAIAFFFQAWLYAPVNWCLSTWVPWDGQGLQCSLLGFASFFFFLFFVFLFLFLFFGFCPGVPGLCWYLKILTVDKRAGKLTWGFPTILKNKEITVSKAYVKKWWCWSVFCEHIPSIKKLSG